MIELRPVRPSDEPFLYELFIASRGEELGFLPQLLVEMQCRAQQSGYLSRFPNALHQIALADGVPCAALWVDYSGPNIRLVDMAVLPVFQRKGIATDLVRQLLERARAAAKDVRLTVRKRNAQALRIYERLGFQVISESELDLEMCAIYGK